MREDLTCTLVSTLIWPNWLRYTEGPLIDFENSFIPSLTSLIRAKSVFQKGVFPKVLEIDMAMREVIIYFLAEGKVDKVYLKIVMLNPHRK